MKIGDIAYFNLINNHFLLGKITDITEKTIVVELINENYQMKHMVEIPLSSILFITYPPAYKG